MGSPCLINGTSHILHSLESRPWPFYPVHRASPAASYHHKGRNRPGPSANGRSRVTETSEQTLYGSSRLSKLKYVPSALRQKSNASRAHSLFIFRYPPGKHSSSIKDSYSSPYCAPLHSVKVILSGRTTLSGEKPITALTNDLSRLYPLRALEYRQRRHESHGLLDILVIDASETCSFE